MNKLLTKEQADWLLKNINKYTEPVNGASNVWFVNSHNIETVINQYTEQKYPEFNILDGAFSVKVIKSVSNILFEIHSDGCMFTEEFKQFTEGCNKIVEWIDGQE